MGVCRHRIDQKPDLLWLHHQQPERFPFLLESCVQGTAQARYDILFALPQSRLWLERDGGLQASADVPLADTFLNTLDQWQAADQVAEVLTDVPFHGGWFVYLGYELVSQVESRVELPVADQEFPLAFAVRCPAAIVWDHEQQCGWVIVEEQFADQAAELLADVGAEFAAVPPLPPLGQVVEDAPAAFASNLKAIHRYILAGDVFQVNISRRWQVRERAAPASVYAALRQTNPAPFAGIARWGDAAVVSSSPERLVEVRHGVAQTRPIAGTRPRDDRRADRAQRAELIGHPKERAEHIMLIDLERNDLGRVCQPGTVEVDELMVIESYAHVHHIVSNVRGTLRDGVTAGQVIRAVFPGGTITGCPKVRCMQIIAELEGRTRGPYTGSMGYLNRDGSMDLNILIRTLLVEPERISFRAGAGIVADSQTERELAETRSKAKGMLLALESGQRARVNGQWSNVVSADDRGLAYGDGIFETIAVDHGQPKRWRWHWRRLQESGRRLGLTVPDESTVLAELKHLIPAQGRCVIKLILTRAAGGRGYQSRPDAGTNLVVQRHQWPTELPAAKVGLRLGVSPVQLGLQPALAGLKHLARLEQVLVANHLASCDWDDSIVCDSAGRVIEASAGNLFLLKAGQLYTPDLSQSGVAGVYRAWLMERCRVQTISIDVDQLAEFDAAFVCNAVRGIVPIAEVVEGVAQFDVEAVLSLRASLGE